MSIETLSRKEIESMYFYGISFSYAIEKFIKIVYKSDNTVNIHVTKNKILNISRGRLRVIRCQKINS